MNDVKRHSRNLRSENNRAFNLSSLEDREPAHEIRVKREFERRMESFESKEDDLADEEKMDKIESFVRDDYFKENRQKEKSKVTSTFRYKSVFIGLLLSLATLYLVFTYILNSALVEVEPKNFESAIKDEIVISNITSPNSYEFVEINKEVLNKLGQLEEKKVSIKATGTITIYNNYSNESQKLVKNTRFESPSGRVFRITESVTVPGMQGQSSGSVKADVIADFVGDEYNIASSKFTIPGFKGSARYDAFYAESADKMLGGSNSLKKIIDAQKMNEIRLKAETEIAKLVNQDIPKISKSGYVVADKVITIDYQDNIDDIVNGKDDTYKVTGRAKVMIINEKSLASAIASKVNNSYLGESVSFIDFKKNDLDIDFASSGINILSDSSMLLKVGATKINIVYDIDSEKIAAALASKSSTKESFSTTMSQFVGIQKAKPTISPFWLTNFPSSPSKIKVIDVSK